MGTSSLSQFPPDLGYPPLKMGDDNQAHPEKHNQDDRPAES